MVSSLISPQWREGHFWKSAIMPGVDNDYSAPAELEFADNFEYAHFHGTEDGTIKYEGASPGPPFLGDNVDVIAAQKSVSLHLIKSTNMALMYFRKAIRPYYAKQLLLSPCFYSANLKSTMDLTLKTCKT